MKLSDVMEELASKGNPATKKTHLRHGAPEPIFGVKIGDLKPIQKKLKGQQDLAYELYATGNSDAMYLAGLIVDGSKMTRKLLDRWVASASWNMIAGFTVPWAAAEHPQAIAIARKWIDSKRELTATAGWATLSSVVSTRPDAELPIDELSGLLDRVLKTLNSSANLVRYVMHNYVICCGTYVAPLADKALATAGKLGVVEVDMGNTDCKVPDAASYILKCRKGAAVAPKRKTTRC